MRLALDTAFSTCSVAVADNAGTLLAFETLEQRRGQAETLVPLTEKILKKAGARAKDISEIVVNTGPGTFAGVRIAAAFARALALSTGAKILGLTAFEALAGTLVAQRKAKPGDTILALVPGKRGEVSACLYRVEKTALKVLQAPETIPLAKLAGFCAENPLLVAGPDLANFEEFLAPVKAKKAYSFWPEARDLLKIAENRKKSGFSETVSPFYLRPPDAKVQKKPDFS